MDLSIRESMRFKGAEMSELNAECGLNAGMVECWDGGMVG